MTTQLPFRISITKPFNSHELLKGSYIAIIHASRIPPHIGIIADSEYHSLTIKGQELNVPVAALIRNSMLRKISSLFIKLKKHPVFSDNYLKEHFCLNVQQFSKVEVGKATCLSPIKLFFEENYELDLKNVNYIFELLPLLEAKGLIEETTAMFINDAQFQLPVYNLNELNKGIDTANKEALAIKAAASGKQNSTLN